MTGSLRIRTSLYNVHCAKTDVEIGRLGKKRVKQDLKVLEGNGAGHEIHGED